MPVRKILLSFSYKYNKPLCKVFSTISFADFRVKIYSSFSTSFLNTFQDTKKKKKTLFISLNILNLIMRLAHVCINTHTRHMTIISSGMDRHTFCANAKKRQNKAQSTSKQTP